MESASATAAVETATPDTGSTSADGAADLPGSGEAQSSSKSASVQEAASEGTLDELPPEYLDRKVTLKIDGKEQRMSVRDAMKVQQLEQVSRTKMNQAATMEKQVRELLTKLEDPREYFRLRGIDPEEFAESTLREKLDLLEKTPDQRELEELRNWRKQTEEQKKATEEKSESERQAKLEQGHQNSFNVEFVDAWKSSGLPPDRLYGQMLAAEMVSATGRNEDLSWKEAAVKVTGKLKKALSSSFSTMDPEGILEWLGQDAFKKLRDHDVKRVSASTPASLKSGLRPDQKRSASPGTEATPKTQKRKSEEEWDSFWKS